MSRCEEPTGTRLARLSSIATRAIAVGLVGDHFSDAPVTRQRRIAEKKD
jgi:hypothetical protein